MNGLHCIYWCITYAACVGVIIPHNGSDDCFYVTSISGNKIADESMDQYDISRVCLGRDKREYGHHSLVECYYYFSLKLMARHNQPLSWLAQFWCSVSSMRKAAGSNPTLAATQGPWTSPSLVVACMTLCGALCGCFAAKFYSCNSLLSISFYNSYFTCKHCAVCQILY